MENRELNPARSALLVNIAEMYFIEGKKQSDIARKIGMTRSNVSRLLKEARQLGIVQVNINYPIQENHALAQEIVERFQLNDAKIIWVGHENHLLQQLGSAASILLKNQLVPGAVVGTTWGTAVSATVDHLVVEERIPNIKVVQLLGALGSRIQGYDGHGIVRRLEEKLDAEGIYMNAPFSVDDPITAEQLMKTQAIKDTLNWGKQADVALLGAGSLELDQCSYYLAGYVSKEEILKIQNTGAIGDVCGRFVNINGEVTANDYQNRLIGISVEDLEKIPIRIGVAGGSSKIDPIIGALRGKLINQLVTDSITAMEVLERTNHKTGY